jgi:Alpha amylase, catalytic domain
MIGAGMRAWPGAPRVYEINTRIWLAEMSRRDGRRLTLAQVPDAELDALARLGFDALWLMGVWSVGPAPIAFFREPSYLDEYRHVLPDLTTEDVAGSPYAVSNYEVDRALGGDTALRTLRDRLAHRGLRLMLDFVPNHTACDHPLIQMHPAAYVGGTSADLDRDPQSFFRTPAGAVIAHGRDPYFPPWRDTAQVNYGHPAARQAMMQTLARIVERCDGVRCDMAMLLLPDVMEKTWGPRLGPHWVRKSFWGEAIAYVRARRPEFLFMAEVYWGLESRLQAEGFDFTYDKSLYDDLRAGDAANVRRHFARPIEAQGYQARFVENHDEPRAAAEFGPRAFAAAVLALLSPGLKLLHDGQLEGRRVKLPVQLRRRPTEPADAATRRFYEALLAVLREPAFGDGSFVPIVAGSAGPGDDTHQSLVAFFRQGTPAPADELGWLVVSNLGPAPAYARIALPVPLDPRREYGFADRLNGSRYVRGAAEIQESGLFVALEPNASHVFRIDR